MVKSEFVTSDKDITQFIDTKTYEKALNQVAKENPNDAFWKKRLETFAERDSVSKKAELDRVEGVVLSRASFEDSECCLQP
jgi:hypothetical protein